ncbi:MAG: response regulator transcription factor, partial [Zoogloea sp.]|nr:response regulator transcription factor [Zoogloea sp.]
PDVGYMREDLLEPFAHDGVVVDDEQADLGGHGCETLERLRRGGIDLLLLDMSMPGISGEDLIGRIHAHHAELPILVLGTRDEPELVRQALRAGASGFLAKRNCDQETLLAAIHRVAAGGRFIAPHLAEQMAFETTSGRGRTHRHEMLSNREAQVLRLLAHGMSINDIAAQLSINNRTVSTHKARLMEKMGFASNAELVRYAVVNGLIE